MTTILSFKQTARRATRVALALVTGAALLCVCTQEDAPDAPDGGDRIPVTFSAGIQSAAVTRTTGLDNNTWTSSDHIGIIMSKAGIDIGYGEGSGVALASNIEYAADKIDLNDKGRSRATFIPVGDPIYYPRTGQVDFHAYYPYTKRDNKGGKLDDQYNLPVDLSDQSNPAAIDVLYAEAKSVIPGRKPVEFDFNHMCAKITLNVAAGEGFTADDIRALPAADVNVKIKTAVILQVATFGRVFIKKESPTKDVHPYKHNVTPAGANAVFSVIFSPRNEKDIPVQFTIGGNTYTVNLTPKDIYSSDPSNFIPWQPGANYVYPVTVKRTGVEAGECSIKDWEVEGKGTATVEKVDLTDFAYIPAGTFLMGSPVTEIGRLAELQHQVTLTRGFYMSKYETTNEQFAVFLNAIHVGSDGTYSATNYPSGLHPGVVLVKDCTKENDGVEQRGMTWDNTKSQWKPMDKCSNLPATDVTWYGADEYARWMGGSLPTEAQWEYACRAGSTTAYTGGDDREHGLGDYGWYYDNSLRHYYTQPVGTKKANAWGLYDMHGNAYEWCSDWFNYSYYESSPAKDPTGPATGNKRVIRGGTYATNPVECRSASRAGAPLIDYEYLYQTGFRIVFNE